MLQTDVFDMLYKRITGQLAYQNSGTWAIDQYIQGFSGKSENLKLIAKTTPFKFCRKLMIA